METGRGQTQVEGNRVIPSRGDSRSPHPGQAVTEADDGRSSPPSGATGMRSSAGAGAVTSQRRGLTLLRAGDGRAPAPPLPAPPRRSAPPTTAGAL